MLSESVFGQEMNSLQAFFGKPITTPQLEIWFAKVKHVSDSVFRLAVGDSIMHEKFMPTIATVLQNAAKAREGQEYTARVSTPSTSGIVQKSAKDSAYSKAAKELFAKACSPKGFPTSEDLAQAMFDLDRAFPNRGWWEEACEVQEAFLLRSGCDPKLAPKKNEKPKYEVQNA